MRSVQCEPKNAITDPHLPKFFVFLRWLDDPESYFCSENIFEAFLKGDFKIAENDNPSPFDINEYRRDLILFDNTKT